MTRFGSSAAVLLTGLLGLTVGAMLYPWENSSDLSGNVRSDEEVAQEYVSYFCFKETWCATVQMLADDEISLADACERVESAAHGHFPGYLRYIADSDPAPTVKEQIAHNLVGHLKCIASADRAFAPRLAKVEREFASLH